MKPNDELNVEIKIIHQEMVEAKKNERANTLKEVKPLCKEFGLTDGMLKGSIVEGRRKMTNNFSLKNTLLDFMKFIPSLH